MEGKAVRRRDRDPMPTGKDSVLYLLFEDPPVPDSERTDSPAKVAKPIREPVRVPMASVSLSASTPAIVFYRVDPVPVDSVIDRDPTSLTIDSPVKVDLAPNDSVDPALDWYQQLR